MKRIKFYSSNDLSAGYYLEMVQGIVERFDKTQTEYAINDTIELYNTVQYLEAGIFLPEWSEDFRDHCKTLAPLLREIVARKFNEIDDVTILHTYAQVEKPYRQDFITILGDLGCIKSISAPAFISLLENESLSLTIVLANKKIVTHYDLELAQYMRSHPESAFVLIEHYDVANRRFTTNIPVSLTTTDKEKLCNEYIDLPDANPNHLKIISQAKYLVLPDIVKLKAKQKYEEYVREHFEKHQGIRYDYSVLFSKKQEELVVESIAPDENKFQYSYASWWIDENLDFPTLLNNFIYMFDFVDTNFRIDLIAKESDLGILEKTLFMRSKSDYLQGDVFRIKEAFSQLQMQGYYDYLRRKDIYLEDIIAWFFKTYIRDEFGIHNFDIDLPRKDLTYKEKCKLILSEFDKILKQIEQLAVFDAINLELLYFSSKYTLIKDIPSLLTKKYAYAKTSQLSGIFFHFFSDQALITMLETDEDRTNELPIFYDMVMAKDIAMADIPERNQPLINELMEMGYLVINEAGHIKFKNSRRMHLLRQLYRYETINLHRLPEQYQNEVLAMASEGLVFFEDTFFSKGEADYYNYHLNKSDFSDGYDLRNKYSHVAQTSHKDNEDTHLTHYLIFLKLMILIIIKLNDELCLRDAMKAIE